MEEWRKIEDNPKYSVSNKGRVRNDETGHILKLCTDYNHRYWNVCIKGCTSLVHRLVAKAFIPNPNNYPIVNHKDENPLNCNVDNLEWCTYQHNSTWNNVHIRRTMNGAGRKKRKCEVDGIVFNCIADAERHFNIKDNCLCVYLRKGYTEYKGHKIKFID